MKNKFSGVWTASVSPFFNGQLDFDSLDRLIEDQEHAGIKGFVVCGTTGESPCLSTEEKSTLFRHFKKQSKLPLIMGTGSNSTNKTIDESKRAQDLGADAILVVVPYYNKPPQRGLLEHFTKVADSVSLPVILYNVPGRTVAKLELSTIIELSQHSNIIGIKEASADMQLAHAIRRSCPKEFLLLSGDDGTYEEFLSLGGDGIISVASHVIPRAFLEGKIADYKDLIDELYSEANPIPVKMALFLRGILQSPELRLPLVSLSKERTDVLRTLMQAKGLV